MRAERQLTSFATGSAAVVALALFTLSRVGADIVNVNIFLPPTRVFAGLPFSALIPGAMWISKGEYDEFGPTVVSLPLVPARFWCSSQVFSQQRVLCACSQLRELRGLTMAPLPLVTAPKVTRTIGASSARVNRFQK